MTLVIEDDRLEADVNLDLDSLRPDLFTRLNALDPEDRKEYYRSLDQEQRVRLAELIDERKRNPYLSFANDPVGFVTSEKGLNETAWSLQRAIMKSVLVNKRTAVPACHAPGKSHIAARIIAWWGSVHPAGTARILTTATTFRQVRNVLWPYIRSVHAAHGLPGQMNMVEWYIGSGPDRVLVAEGVKPPDDDEAALSGMHAPHTLIVVDEAGGISHAFGRGLLGLMTGSHTRLLLIGNPAIDDEGSWFEKQCERTDLFNVIPIPWKLTPNYTGEYVGWCKVHPGMERHLVNEHLIDSVYVDELVREYGEGSAVVIARRDAQFPKTNESKALPIMWLENARAVTTFDPASGQDESILDVHKPGPIKLGVDPAAGGDKFTIYALDGDWVYERHSKSENANRDPEFVEAKIIEHAIWAAGVHAERGITKKVRVKVDSLGIGWALFANLKRYVKEHPQCGFVFIEVKAGDTAKDSDHFANVRAEMWWTLRAAIALNARGDIAVKLNVSDAVIAQLNGPKYISDSRGKIQIEKKVDMKARGLHSPDDADAICMALYEPEDFNEIPSGVGAVVIGSTTPSMPPRPREGGPSSFGFVAL